MPTASAEAYGRQLKSLLPPGALWNLSPASWLSRLLVVIGEELSRVDGRTFDLVEEWDPSTATECLEDWERVLGLPDGTYIPSTAVADRRLEAAAKYMAQGGATPAYFVALAARLGLVATVVEAGLDPHHWRMDIDTGASTGPFTVRAAVPRCGRARCGQTPAHTAIPELETPVYRLKPAHTIVWFLYV